MCIRDSYSDEEHEGLVAGTVMSILEKKSSKGTPYAIIKFSDKKGEFDKVFEIKGVKVYCDLKSWLYVKGTTIDFSDDLLSGGFKIENPNAERTCGCGTSFSV